MRRRQGALAAAIAALVAACGTTAATPPALASTRDLISTAAGHLTETKGYHLVISYSQGGASFQSDLHIALPSDVTGSVTENGSSVQVLQAGGKLYVQGQDFISEYAGSKAGRLYGNRWILATPDLLRTTVLDVTRLTSIARTLLGLNFQGKRTDHVPAAMQSTAQLTGDFGSMFIMEEEPHFLVKVETAPGYMPVPGFSNVSMEILDYDVPVTVTAPADFADPADPTTLPPDFELNNTPTDSGCDQTGCGFAATVINNGGAYPASAPSTFTYTLKRADHSLIDRCSGVIPVVGHRKTESISCRVTSQAWRSWADSGGTFYYQVTTDNPAYDG